MNENTNILQLCVPQAEEQILSALEVCALSEDSPKKQFIIKYDPIERETLGSELNKIGCTWVRWLEFANCVVIHASKEQLQAIKTLNCVDAVEVDYDYKVLTKESNSCCTTTINDKNDDHLGRRINLAVFDTGNTAAAEKNTVSFVEKVTVDVNGHGTEMMSIISSKFEKSDYINSPPGLFSVIVANEKGMAKTSAIMAALNWAIEHEINIICMSFGDYRRSKFLEEMINRAHDCGIILVAAAGNDGAFRDETRVMYPAAFDNVLSVGALFGESVAAYSNGGTNVDCLAPGTQNAIDVNGNAVEVSGTSAATAFVAKEILKIWCNEQDLVAEEIVSKVKAEMTPIAENTEGKCLTQIEKTSIIENTTSEETFAPQLLKMESPDSLVEETLMAALADESDGETTIQEKMASAQPLPFYHWTNGKINCPFDEVWYKFVANVSSVHPGGSPGWYTVHTQGSLDTLGYLYDSAGNLIAFSDDDTDMNFNIWAELESYKTYYICVRAFASNTGDYQVRLSCMGDDHGNTLETATDIIGVYYEDKTVEGSLHSVGDVDYYSIVPARNCVMEIYTEGNTNTRGVLYCSSGGYLDSDTNSNGNGNFKITAHLEAMKRYYIAVSHDFAGGYGDYMLRFKFIKDFSYNIIDEQYRVMFWYADNQDEQPLPCNTITRSRVFVSNKAKAEFEDRVILDEYRKKSGLEAVLSTGMTEDIINYLAGFFLALIPGYGNLLSNAYSIGSMVLSYMNSIDVEFYRMKKVEIENTNEYIIGEHYRYGGDYYMCPSNYVMYSSDSGTYYGKPYQRGEFTETYIKHS